MGTGYGFAVYVMSQCQAHEFESRSKERKSAKNIPPDH